MDISNPFEDPKQNIMLKEEVKDEFFGYPRQNEGLYGMSDVGDSNQYQSEKASKKSGFLY